jgi:hypothetical protein
VYSQVPRSLVERSVCEEFFYYPFTVGGGDVIIWVLLQRLECTEDLGFRGFLCKLKIVLWKVEGLMNFILASSVNNSLRILICSLAFSMPNGMLQPASHSVLERKDPLVIIRVAREATWSGSWLRHENRLNIY